MVRIAEIEAGSIADELHLEIGTRIVRINGRTVRDGLDLTFLLADGELELETVTPEGEPVTYEVAREPWEPMGIVPAPDKIRECANECVFCFIDGNPEGVRDSLWLRDDDFRLSFTYGSYVTLTNLGPRGLERLVEQRLSPLYVSVHATDPELRERLLKNRRAGEITDQLRFLLDGGLEVHTQVVLCPGWNDGAQLDRTIDDLWALGDGVRSLSVVPVGLTKYNAGRPVRPLTEDEAGAALEQVDRARTRGYRERGHGWCYGADQLFLEAGRPLPDDGYYDDWPLLENGVGALRRFLTDFHAGADRVEPVEARRVVVLTGAAMGPFLAERAPLLAERTGAEVEVVAVENDFFGATVTVAGLLAGRDLLDAIPRGLDQRDVVLLPAEALNADDLFIDSLSLDEFRREAGPVRVEPGYELTDLLRSLG